MHESFPLVRFFERVEDRTYRLKEVQRDKSVKEIGRFETKEGFEGVVCDYRLAFLDENKLFLERLDKATLHTFQKTVGQFGISPDGESFMYQFKEDPTKILLEKPKEGWKRVRETPDYDNLELSFLDNDTYEISSPGNGEGVMGRVKDFGKAIEISFGPGYHYSGQNGYFVIEKDEVTLSLSKVDEKTDFSKTFILDLEVGVLPMYRHALTRETFSREWFLSLVKSKKERKRLAAMSKEDLRDYYFNKFLMNDERPEEVQFAGEFVMLYYLGFEGYREHPPEVLIWKVSNVSKRNFIPPLRRVETENRVQILANGLLSGVDFPAEGYIWEAFSCCDVEKINSQMRKESPIPKELVDILTGFL